MSSKPTRIAALSLSFLTIAACGDSGTGGAGGTGTTTTSTTSASSSKSSTAASGSTSSATTTTTGAAQGSTSSGMQDCSNLATKADCRNCCGMQNPTGTVTLVHDVTNECGCLANATCSAECTGEAFCTDGTSQLGATCNACIGGLQGNEACVMTAITTCQQDPPCADAADCQLSCLGLP